MIKISKITDYAIVILSLLAKKHQQSIEGTIHPGDLLSATEISHQTNITMPMVAKILKILTRNKLLNSVRGVHGGYQLLINPNQISVTQIIEIFEGPMAIMECNINQHKCSIFKQCNINSHFNKINQIIYNTLNKFTLNQLSS
jgi:FeS assembly SUF system regulator